MSSKLNLKIVRSFSIGFSILSPKWNGLCVEVHLGFFHLVFWSRGTEIFGFNNYWNG